MKNFKRPLFLLSLFLLYGGTSCSTLITQPIVEDELSIDEKPKENNVASSYVPKTSPSSSQEKEEQGTKVKSSQNNESDENNNEEETIKNTYTITWKNFDGTIIEVDEVNKGELPIYLGEEPTRKNTNDFLYYFNSWSPSITNATCDATYIATYDLVEVSDNPGVYTKDKKISIEELIEEGYIDYKEDEDNDGVSITGQSFYNLEESENPQTLVIPSQLGGKTVTTIDDNAFEGTSVFKEIILPNTIKKIGNESFVSASIESIYIPSSVKEIGEGAFVFTNLKELELPANVTSIGNSAFYFNEQLKSVEIKNPNMILGDSLFESCTNLENVILPDGMTSLSSNIFAYCNINEIDLPQTLTTIGSNAFIENSLETIVIPESVTYIGESAFRNNNLRNINIPSKVTTVEYCTFAENNLQSLVVPSQITKIYEAAFSTNPELKDVHINSPVIDIEEAFTYCDNLDTFIVELAQDFKIMVSAFIFSPNARIFSLDTSIGFENSANIYYPENADFLENQSPLIGYSNGVEIYYYSDNLSDIGSWHYDENNQPVINV